MLTAKELEQIRQIIREELAGKMDAEATARLSTLEQIKADYRKKYPRGKRKKTDGGE